MSFLLDQGAAVALFRGNRHMTAHARNQAGNLSISALTAFGIEVWLLRPTTPSRFVSQYQQFRKLFQVREVTERIATEAARLSPRLSSPPRVQSLVPATLAATALQLSLTLVTHDLAFYAVFPGLLLADWSVP